MSRKVTIFTGQWADLPFEELCAKVKSFGYDGIEIACWGDHMDLKRAATDPKYAEGRKAILAKNGLGCWALGTHLPGQCVGDLWGPEARRLRAARARGEAREDPRVGDPGDEVRGARRQGHGLQGRDGLHGLSHLEVLVLIPPDHPGDGRRGLQGDSEALEPHLR